MNLLIDTNADPQPRSLPIVKIPKFSAQSFVVVWVLSLIVYFSLAGLIMPLHIGQQRDPALQPIEQFLNDYHLGFIAFVAIALAGVFAIVIGPIGVIVIGIRKLIRHCTRKPESTSE